MLLVYCTSLSFISCFQCRREKEEYIYSCCVKLKVLEVGRVFITDVSGNGCVIFSGQQLTRSSLSLSSQVDNAEGGTLYRSMRKSVPTYHGKGNETGSEFVDLCTINMINKVLI